ncbi:hypothetical protein [Aliiroseovarius sp. F47248L]|uniref:hypothetical protein n=1 Tax=Aliiroseovarius sp. F47248L TaxID=2926420 RepID=UPI001FF1C35D|nr:hypothetical protein [Aliiroseovarius sp. F47248L]MCK0140010.1 hypothetical protein [Aliiroseovarius sp. F47248L]
MNTHSSQIAPRFGAQKIIAVVALVFGLMTVFSGGNVLFGAAQAREAAGDYIPFVVWFNFLAGFAYIVAAIGLWLDKTWATWLAAAIAAATAIVTLAFAITIIRGSAFEMRTVGALSLRFLFWTVVAVTTRSRAKRG